MKFAGNLARDGTPVWLPKDLLCVVVAISPSSLLFNQMRYSRNDRYVAIKALTTRGTARARDGLILELEVLRRVSSPPADQLAAAHCVTLIEHFSESAKAPEHHMSHLPSV